MKRGLYRHRPMTLIHLISLTTKTERGCWEFVGAKNKGYGVLGFDGQRGRSTHRIMWELVNGQIPSNLCVLHKCDNPSCINPDHLFLGTQRDNMQDMFCKGRRILTTESREKIARAKIGNTFGRFNLGKRRSNESRHNMSIAAKKRKPRLRNSLGHYI